MFSNPATTLMQTGSNEDKTKKDLTATKINKK
jgi:hypothetical protein